MRCGLPFFSLLLGLAAAGGAEAASLRIMPVTLSFAAPAAAGSLTLSNGDAKPINVQARVFRWRQADGKETLEETKDVVVSPPFAKVAAGGNYTIRVLRLNKQPVAAEESYRVLIDQLPEPGAAKDQTVKLLLRYSIPVFFATANPPKPAAEWTMRRQGDRYVLAVANKGGSHIKLADVELVDAGGKTTQVTDGLLGYVLGGSSMNWTLPPRLASMAAKGKALRFANGTGSIDVPITVKDSR